MSAVTFGAEPSIVVQRAVAAFAVAAPALADPSITKVAQVIDVVRSDLFAAGWDCATGARSATGLCAPGYDGEDVLVDGWHPSGSALWVETGMAWTNFGFLRHAVEVSLIPRCTAAVIAVPERYNSQPAFKNCAAFLRRCAGQAIPPWGEASLTLLGF